MAERSQGGHQSDFNHIDSREDAASGRDVVRVRDLVRGAKVRGHTDVFNDTGEAEEGFDVAINGRCQTKWQGTEKAWTTDV